MSWIENPGEYLFDGLDLSLLNVDEAYLNIKTDSPFSLYLLSDECYRCPFSFFKKVEQSEVVKVPTKHGVTLRLYNNDRSVDERGVIPDGDTKSMLCELRPHFGEFGVYGLGYSKNECTLHTYKKPVNVYLPLLLILLGLIVLAAICTCASLIYDRYFKPIKDHETNPENVAKRKRVKALDTFRGISIVLMIFVNNGGGSYWFFEHAVWNGLQVADLVFPWFLWIMGVCIPISIKSQIKRNVKRTTMLLGVIRRSAILFLLGLCLNTVGVGADLNNLRLFGVLQRFAITYLVVAFIAILFTINRYGTNNTSAGVNAMKDFLYLIPQWIVVLIILAGYSYLTFFFPVPGCPTGYIGPGGIQFNSKYQNCTGGASGYIDRLLLGQNHIYQNPTSVEVYRTGPFDPEGLLGCLTSIFQVFLGVQAGAILVYQSEWGARLKRWLIWGTIFGLIGAVLCQARQESGWVPLNKNIWSISYVCVTSCFAFFLLSLLYFLIDIRKTWSGAPFVFAGMNAIILYVGHQLCYNVFPWHWRYGPMNTHFILTLEALWGTALWVLISYWLYTEKFFLSL